jgi:hypothetical protein
VIFWGEIKGLKTANDVQDFVKKLTKDVMQKMLDEGGTKSIKWLDYYNTQRTHQGKMCLDRTHFHTLIDGKLIWNQKIFKFILI